MPLCKICGIVRKTTIVCNRCNADICLNDFWVREGLCSDCIVLVYNEKYLNDMTEYIGSLI